MGLSIHYRDYSLSLDINCNNSIVVKEKSCMKVCSQEWLDFAKADLISCERMLNDEFLFYC